MFHRYHLSATARCAFCSINRIASLVFVASVLIGTQLSAQTIEPDQTKTETKSTLGSEAPEGAEDFLIVQILMLGCHSLFGFRISINGVLIYDNVHLSLRRNKYAAYPEEFTWRIIIPQPALLVCLAA